jgi:hypothetical protein
MQVKHFRQRMWVVAASGDGLGFCELVNLAAEVSHPTQET